MSWPVDSLPRDTLVPKIDAAMLHRLSSAIERLPGFEIDRLRPFCEAPQETRDAPVVTLQNLSAAGLLNSVSGWGALVYQPNEVSEAFLRLELDRVR